MTWEQLSLTEAIERANQEKQYDLNGYRAPDLPFDPCPDCGCHGAHFCTGKSYSNRLKELNKIPETADEAIVRAGEHADVAWKKKALEIVQDLCNRQQDFTTDDVHALLEVSGASTKEPRALGAILRLAARNHWCTNTMRFVKSQRPECHRRPIPFWQSLLFR